MDAVRLGLDIGTTAIKAAAYTLQGALVARMEAPSRSFADDHGGTEQNMMSVWRGVCETLRGICDQLEGRPIASLGVCGQGDGLWLLGHDGSPLGHAMLWNDTRAARDMAALDQSGALDTVGLASHTALWPGTSGMLWRWLERHDPDRAAQAAHAMTCADWIGYCLTGVIATDFSNATIPFLDLQTRRYSPDALSAMGCAGLAPLLADPRPADSQLGTVTADAATATGLPVGLPVNVPTLDLAAMIVGMGLHQPGDCMFIMGTTAVVNILTDRVEPTPRPVGASALHASSDAIIRIFAPTTGASAFDWFAGLHPLSLAGADAGEVADKLNVLVKDVPPGANGVTFLPYLNGERAPFVAPEISASFHGLRARTTKAEMGRAVMEGTALSLRHCLTAEGHVVEGPVKLAGGGSRNPLWSQIIADVTGTEVVVTRDSDHGLWGAACLGASAAGLGSVGSLTQRDEELAHFPPNPDAAQAYDRVFDRYQTLSDAARATARALSQTKDHP